MQDATDFGFQTHAFTPQILGALRFVPDIGLFEFALDFDQALLLGIEVKDTPVRPGSDPGGRAAC
jgi:hypothetical protein